MKPRGAEELCACADGLAGVTFRSRPLLPLAQEEFRGREKLARRSLQDLPGRDLSGARARMTGVVAGAGRPLVLGINGNEAPDGREERDFLRAIKRAGHVASVIDPRGVGMSRPELQVRGRDHADPRSGVEENIAYNAYLVGRSLLGLRVSDVLAAVREVAGTRPWWPASPRPWIRLSGGSGRRRCSGVTRPCSSPMGIRSTPPACSPGCCATSATSPTCCP